MKNNILKLCGFVSLGTGILGIFLPLLPTTPFLLLSSYLFMKSSKRWHKWLLENKRLGIYIKDFQEDKSIPLRVKICSISLLWITISYSALFAVDNIWVRILLCVIAIGVTIHILSYKTKEKS